MLSDYCKPPLHAQQGFYSQYMCIPISLGQRDNTLNHVLHAYCMTQCIHGYRHHCKNETAKVTTCAVSPVALPWYFHDDATCRTHFTCSDPHLFLAKLKTITMMVHGMLQEHHRFNQFHRESARYVFKGLNSVVTKEGTCTYSGYVQDLGRQGMH